MNLRTIIGFLFGQRGAIEAVARNRSSIWTGIVLVLITAIPRNYDQLYILESPFWLIGPLLFSFFSGSFLYLVLSLRLLRPNPLPAPAPVEATAGLPLSESPAQSKTRLGQWRCFMGLFWMTAPIAWLYAIPVERIFDSYRAAIANLTLLGIVSVWRVVLMARILAVASHLFFPRALVWVLIAASLEALIVSFATSMGVMKNVLASMGGMRHAPEEYLLIGALQVIFGGAIVTCVAGYLLLQLPQLKGSATAFPAIDQKGLPIRFLVAAWVAWSVVAILPQREQHLFVTHAKLVESERYRDSLDFLRSRSPEAFPPSRRLEPNPYERRVYEHLPGIIAHLQAEDPEWIRQIYFGHLEALLGHHDLYGSPADYLGMLEALARIPGGTDWAQAHADGLRKVVFLTRWIGTKTDRDASTESLEAALARLGIEAEKPKP